MDFEYKRIFKPTTKVDLRSSNKEIELADRRDGKVYVYDEHIILMVNVALATRRPLLIRGPSGCGKSSLAYNIARVYGANYYEYVVTSRSQARDILYRFNAVRRLGDVQARQPPFVPVNLEKWHLDYPYIEPGVLWWIFDPFLARTRGWEAPAGIDLENFPFAKDPAVYRPNEETIKAVLLIDEIDKADPDFANNLLVPFGSFQFSVEETNTRINYGPVYQQPDHLSNLLLIITSNQERELPNAFMRRCLILDMALPDENRLLDIAILTEGDQGKDLYKTLIDKIKNINSGLMCSVPEFLDIIRACKYLEINQEGGLIQKILESTFERERQ